MCDVIKERKKEEGRREKFQSRFSTCVCGVGEGRAGGAGRIKFFTIRFGSTSLLNNTTLSILETLFNYYFPLRDYQ